MAVILHYSNKFSGFGANYVSVIEVRPILSAIVKWPNNSFRQYLISGNILKRLLIKRVH